VPDIASRLPSRGGASTAGTDPWAQHFSRQDRMIVLLEKIAAGGVLIEEVA